MGVGFVRAAGWAFTPSTGMDGRRDRDRKQGPSFPLPPFPEFCVVTYLSFTFLTNPLLTDRPFPPINPTLEPHNISPFPNGATPPLKLVWEGTQTPGKVGGRGLPSFSSGFFILIWQLGGGGAAETGFPSSPGV